MKVTGESRWDNVAEVMMLNVRKKIQIPENCAKKVREIWFR